jgi:hypothetical protein
LTATATDPAQVTGAASAVFSITVDADTGQQDALGVTINGGNPIAAAIATAFRSRWPGSSPTTTEP